MDRSNWYSLILKEEHLIYDYSTWLMLDEITDWLLENLQLGDWHFHQTAWSPDQRSWVSVANQGYIRFVRNKQELLFKYTESAMLFKLTWY